MAMAKAADEAGRHRRKPVLHRHGRRHRAAPEYAVVGEVTDGQDVVDAIGHARRPGDREADRAGRHLHRHRPRELMGRIAAVVLAAGEASRYGAPKQVLLLPEVLARLDAGSGRRDRRRRGRAPARHVCRFDTSARCALRRLGARARRVAALRARGARPTRSTLRSSCSPTAPISRRTRSPASSTAWRAGAGEVVAASYGGERGHPLLDRPDRLGGHPRRGPARTVSRHSSPATTSARPATSTGPRTCPSGSGPTRLSDVLGERRLRRAGPRDSASADCAAARASPSAPAASARPRESGTYMRRSDSNL